MLTISFSLCVTIMLYIDISIQLSLKSRITNLMYMYKSYELLTCSSSLYARKIRSLVLFTVQTCVCLDKIKCCSRFTVCIRRHDEMESFKVSLKVNGCMLPQLASLHFVSMIDIHCRFMRVSQQGTCMLSIERGCTVCMQGLEIH